MSNTFTIQNRRGLNMEVISAPVENPRGTAIVHHGYPGAACSPTIKHMADIFNALSFNAITPNTTNNYNNSDGKLKDMTLAGHCDDLEDVAKYIVDSECFVAPLIIAGHSAGGHSALVVSSRLKGKYRPALTVASAPVISGASFIRAWENILRPEGMLKWKTDGYIIGQSDAGPDELKIHWSVMEEWATHDLIRDQLETKPANPTIIIHPRNDPFTPATDIYSYNQLVGVNSYHFIHDADHCYEGQKAVFEKTLTQAIQRHIPRP